MLRRSSYPAILTLTFAFAITFTGLTALAGEKLTKNEVTGKEYYQQYCASCHIAGGNLAKTTKPIAGSSMLKSVALFQKYLENPPGHMPYYKSVVGNQKTLQKLYEYCRKLKKTQSA